MLNLSRYPGQKIVVTHEPTGDQLLIEVHEVNPDKAVQLRLKADRCFLIDREEIHEDKKLRGPITEAKTRGNIKHNLPESRPTKPPPAPKGSAEKYRECPRCAGRGKCKSEGVYALIECPDCEGEGKIDSRGYPPSYDKDQDQRGNK